VGDIFFSLLWFFMFFIWIWLLIMVFADVFRSDDLGGWAKALWTLFVIVLPYLGVFIYLVARGNKLSERAASSARRKDEHMRAYVQGVAGSGSSPAAEIQHLSELRSSGVLTDDEFARAKAKLLA